MVATAMRPIYAQPDAAHVPEQFDEIVSMLTQRFSDAATMLVDARDDVLAFKAFPQARWRNTWSTNPLERLKGEIKRRTRVVGIFPTDAAVLRLVTGDTAHTSILRRNEPPAAGTRSSVPPAAPHEAQLGFKMMERVREIGIVNDQPHPRQDKGGYTRNHEHVDCEDEMRSSEP